MLESWFYTIFTMKALGRKEIVKNVQQVSLIYLFQNLSLFVLNITLTSSGTPAFHKSVLLFNFTKSICYAVGFGEPRSSCNFVKETPLCKLLPNVLLGQLLLSAASPKKLLQRCRVVFSPLSNMYDISFL